MTTYTFDATAGGASATSYASVAEADDYHDSIPSAYTGTWTAATTAQKQASLMQATRLLDAMVLWEGIPADADTQRLAWPRDGVITYDGEEFDADDGIPQFLIDATSEFARQLLAKDRTKDTIRGYKRIKTGDVEIEFDHMNTPRIIPQAVRLLIAPYGTIKEYAFSRRVARA